VTVKELLAGILRLYDEGLIDDDTPVKVLVSEEFLERLVDRVETPTTDRSALPLGPLILRTPEAS
jgi:hypothetical protein